MTVPRAFDLLLMARGLGAIAAQGAPVTIGWMVLDVTGSALGLGLIGLVRFLSMLALTFLSGHVADQYDRRRIVLVCFAIEALMIFDVPGHCHGRFAPVGHLYGAGLFGRCAGV